MSRPDRDKLVEDHLPLARSIAIKIHGGLPECVDVGDLINSGTIGLLMAADRFDSSQGVAFRHYAGYRIRGEILDSLRGLDWASRDTRRLYKKVEEIKRHLHLVLGREPEGHEVARELGVTDNRWKNISIDLRNVGLTSASSNPNQRIGEREFATTAKSADFLLGRKELHELLWSAMDELPPRYRQVLILYYVEEMTMKQVGEVLKVNESRISQLHRRALEAVNQTLTARELTRAAFA